MTATLHIFALNREIDIRHTNLTRAKGEKADLPPLAAWLGVEALDPYEIEIFPVRDLDGMSLSDYVTAAFAPEAKIEAGLRARLDALDGSVLLVPGEAMTGTPAPGPEAVHVGDVALARPDHSMDMTPVQVRPSQSDAPAADSGQRGGSAASGRLVWVALGLIVLGLILWIAT